MKTIDAQKPGEDSRKSTSDKIRRYAPLAGTLVLAGALLLSPSSCSANADPSPQTCTASIEKGKVKSFSSQSGTDEIGIRLDVLLPQKGRYLRVMLPHPYVDSLMESVEAKPQTERDAFLDLAIEGNIERGYESVEGKSKPARFECVPIAELNPPSSSSAAVKPSDTQGAIPEVSPPAKAGLPLLPKEVVSGDGSKGKPYEVVLGNGKEEDGIGGQVIGVTFPLIIDGVSTAKSPIYMTVDFKLSSLRTESLEGTTNELSSVTTGIVNRYAAERGAYVDQKAMLGVARGLRDGVYDARSSAAQIDPEMAGYLGVKGSGQ